MAWNSLKSLPKTYGRWNQDISEKEIKKENTAMTTGNGWFDG